MATVPITAMVPSSGVTSPASKESSVVLPLPFDPTSAIDVPRLELERGRREGDGAAVVDAHVVGDGQQFVARRFCSG